MLYSSLHGTALGKKPMFLRLLEATLYLLGEATTTTNTFNSSLCFASSNACYIDINSRKDILPCSMPAMDLRGLYSYRWVEDIFLAKLPNSQPSKPCSSFYRSLRKPKLYSLMRTKVEYNLGPRSPYPWYAYMCVFGYEIGRGRGEVRAKI